MALIPPIITDIEGNVLAGATDSGKPVKVGGVYNTTPPTYTAGQRGDLQIDAHGNLMVNQRYLTIADLVTAQNPVATNLNAYVWLGDGQGASLASWPATGGVNILKVTTTDTRILYPSSGSISASGNSGDLSTNGPKYLSLDVNITSQSGTSPTITFFLDRKGADNIYYQIWASPVSSAASTFLSVNFGPGLTTVAPTWAVTGSNTVGNVQMIVGSTMRLRWTIGGSATPTIVCSVNLFQQS